MNRIVSPKLQRLFADWEARRQLRFPRRSDFDPRDLSYTLGALSIMEIHRDPLRFRLRLHGTEMVERLGFDLTGKFLNEAPNQDWANLVRGPLEAVANSGLPSVSWHANERVMDQVWDIERLVLPISRDGTVCDMLITAFDQFRTPETAGHDRLRSGLTYQ